MSVIFPIERFRRPAVVTIHDNGDHRPRFSVWSDGQIDGLRLHYRGDSAAGALGAAVWAACRCSRKSPVDFHFAGIRDVRGPEE